MLLRTSRRKTSWESATAFEDAFHTEFCSRGSADLRPSVYEVAADEVVQVHAEHSASIPLDPPRGGTHLDCAGHGYVVVSPGSSRFRRTRDSHRELIFTDENELITFLRGIVVRQEDRSHQTTKADVSGYVRQMITDNDEEWVEFCRESPKAAKWGCSAAS